MSGISASLSGLQTSALSVAVASQNVANVNSVDFKARRLEQQTLADGGVQATGVQESQAPANSARGSNVDLATEAVSLSTDKVTYESNLQFLQAQTAMLGMAMDMKA